MRIAASVSLFAVVTAWLLFPANAWAGEGCPPGVPETDKAAVLAKMQEVAGKLAMDMKTLRSCIREKDAYATVSLERTPLPDGSHLQNFIMCWRDPTWGCSVHSPRALMVPVKIGARTVQILAHLGDSYTAAVGRAYVQRAVEIAPTLTERQECSYTPARLAEIRKELTKLKSDFRFTGENPEVSIQQGGNGPAGVGVGGHDIGLEPDESGKGWKLRCWNTHIVIG